MKLICILSLIWLLACCDRSNQSHRGEVVIYTSLDRPHSKPVLDLFEQKTGIRVKALYDTEASKTVGMVNRLINSKGQTK